MALKSSYSIPPVVPSTFGIEGADEFSQFGIPQQYAYNWDMSPWIESPLSILRPPAPEMIYTPEGGAAPYDPNAFKGDSLDIAKYRYDPFGGYMQYQDTSGNLGYLMGTGRQLDEGISMSPNYENQGLEKWLGPSPNEEWLQLGYDPYGIAASQKSPYKIREDVGQGGFSQNMDKIAALAALAAGGYAAYTGLGAGAGASGAGAAAGGLGVDDALGAFLMEAGELPAASAYGQAVLAGTPNWAIPGISGAGGSLGYFGSGAADLLSGLPTGSDFMPPAGGGGEGYVPPIEELEAAVQGMTPPWMDPNMTSNMISQAISGTNPFAQSPFMNHEWITSLGPKAAETGGWLSKLGSQIAQSFENDPLKWITSGVGAAMGLYTGKQQQDYYKKILDEERKRREAAEKRQAQVDRPLQFQGTPPKRTFSFDAPYDTYGRSGEYDFVTEDIPISRETFTAARGGALASLIQGPGGGQDDNVIGRLSPGEYVWDAETVSALGDGSNEEGARRLDQMRQNVRAHKRKVSVKKIPPKAKRPETYLKGK